MTTETKELLKQIRAWTKEKRGRISAVASALGVEHQTVANWLNGRKKPRLVHWNDLQAYWVSQHEQTTQ